MMTRITKFKLVLILLLITSVLSLGACQNQMSVPAGIATPQNILEGTSSGNPPGVQANSFKQVFNNVFSSNCVSCHNSAKAEGGVRYDSYKATLKYGNLSVLARDYDHYREPSSQCKSISSENMDLVRNWIENGALR